MHVFPQRPNGGWGALHVACRDHDSWEVEDVLQSRGVNSVLERTNYGWTPLHVAADAGRCGIVSVLLNGMKTAPGMTPQAVLKAISCKTASGETALSLAEARRQALLATATDHRGKCAVAEAEKLIELLKEEVNILTHIPSWKTLVKQTSTVTVTSSDLNAGQTQTQTPLQGHQATPLQPGVDRDAGAAGGTESAGDTGPWSRGLPEDVVLKARQAKRARLHASKSITSLLRDEQLQIHSLKKEMNIWRHRARQLAACNRRSRARTGQLEKELKRLTTSRGEQDPVATAHTTASTANVNVPAMRQLSNGTGCSSVIDGIVHVVSPVDTPHPPTPPSVPALNLERDPRDAPPGAHARPGSDDAVRDLCAKMQAAGVDPTAFGLPPPPAGSNTISSQHPRPRRASAGVDSSNSDSAAYLNQAATAAALIEAIRIGRRERQQDDAQARAAGQHEPRPPPPSSQPRGTGRRSSHDGLAPSTPPTRPEAAVVEAGAAPARPGSGGVGRKRRAARTKVTAATRVMRAPVAPAGAVQRQDSALTAGTGPDALPRSESAPISQQRTASFAAGVEEVVRSPASQPGEPISRRRSVSFLDNASPPSTVGTFTISPKAAPTMVPVAGSGSAGAPGVVETVCIAALAVVGRMAAELTQQNPQLRSRAESIRDMRRRSSASGFGRIDHPVKLRDRPLPTFCPAPVPEDQHHEAPSSDDEEAVLVNAPTLDNLTRRWSQYKHDPDPMAALPDAVDAPTSPLDDIAYHLLTT